MVYNCLSPFWGGGWTMVFMILAWAIGIGIIIWAVTRMNKGGLSFCHDHDDLSGKSHQKSALEMAQERYAKGEINKKEYEEMKKELEK